MGFPGMGFGVEASPCMRFAKYTYGHFITMASKCSVVFLQVTFQQVWDTGVVITTLIEINVEWAILLVEMN